jgi:hypothetical protein
MFDARFPRVCARGKEVRIYMTQHRYPNLYDILGIPEDIILDKSHNINHWLYLVDQSSCDEEELKSMNRVVALINKFHSYFHFEQSFAYTICAYIYHLKSEVALRLEYLEKAIFQDHINRHAIDFKNLINDEHSIDSHMQLLLSYGKNHPYEKEFLRFAIGEFAATAEVELMDEAIGHALSGKISEAKSIMNGLDYRSHRLGVCSSIVAIFERDLDSGLEVILKTLKAMENAHQNYHKLASLIYLKRSDIFGKLDQMDLAKNDRVKANDLFPLAVTAIKH